VARRATVAEKLATLKDGQRRGTEAASHEAARSQAEAAAALHVSRASVQRARVVREQAAPELVKAVERGRIEVGQAEPLAKLSRQEPAAIALEADERKRRKLVKDGQRGDDEGRRGEDERGEGLAARRSPAQRTLAAMGRRRGGVGERGPPILGIPQPRRRYPVWPVPGWPQCRRRGGEPPSRPLSGTGFESPRGLHPLAPRPICGVVLVA
jgi:hypothetical protein